MENKHTREGEKDGESNRLDSKAVFWFYEICANHADSNISFLHSRQLQIHVTLM